MIRNIYNKKEIEKLFFVVATGRSGSNMLIELLNSIQNVFMRMELQVPNNNKTQNEESLANISNFLMSERYIPPTKIEYTITGCKLLDTHVWLCDIDQKLLDSFNLPMRVIHLYRKNILDQFLSLKLAQKNNKWISTNRKDGTYEEYNVSIDVKEFKEYETHKIKKYSEYKEKFPDAYIVDYEELSKDPQFVFDKGLFQFLGVAPQPVLLNTIKQNKKPREEIIINFNDVKDIIEKYL